ncbi:unnamed protein product [Chondrus crispus]|uniref:Uncharacterized protein n=1 Tax=Chondrus crispus TaxID=2769 RepID=R7QJJ4_CHOCR|nr:unnamed protein product [Chondrus crispus]CDF38687.1 unnamed protein product [Chondrus crispus]|eukprot:XP_005718592.1 unnamed protein product [Chondrus crispus]
MILALYSDANKCGNSRTVLAKSPLRPFASWSFSSNQQQNGVEKACTRGVAGDLPARWLLFVAGAGCFFAHEERNLCHFVWRFC